MKLCENIINSSYGLTICYKCKLDDNICFMYRYCVKDRAIKMTPNYFKFGCIKKS